MHGFYDLSKTIWGGSCAVTSLQEGIDSSGQPDEKDVDYVLNGPCNQPGSSSIISNSFPSLKNVADGLDDEDQILQ